MDRRCSGERITEGGNVLPRGMRNEIFLIFLTFSCANFKSIYYDNIVSNIRILLGANIRRIRKARHWTRVSLANKADISPTFLLHIEAGTRGVSLETIECIAKALNIRISQLFENCDSEESGFVSAETPDSPELLLEEEIRQQVGIAVQRYLEAIRSGRGTKAERKSEAATEPKSGA